MIDPNCLFCRILRGEIPAKKIYEDDHVFAFEDINPQAPTHALIIPKKHFAGLKEAQAADAEIIGRCHLATGKFGHPVQPSSPLDQLGDVSIGQEHEAIPVRIAPNS